MQNKVKTEEEIKANILDILDPAKMSTNLVNKSVEELREILNKRTNTVGVVISHNTFQEIYDKPTMYNIKGDENIILKNRILKQNSMINELRNILKEKEEQILDLTKKYEELKIVKSFKSEIYEEGSYAAYIAAKEAEEENDEMPQIVKPVEHRIKPYVAYTPNKRTIESMFEDKTSLYNGNIKEKDAIELAIKKSEDDASNIIDSPFENNDNPFNDEDFEPVKKSYNNLKNRPVMLTDDMLDELYEILINRDFDSIKIKLNSWPSEVSRYIRLLSYNDETFKQMQVSKSINIHKCLIGGN